MIAAALSLQDPRERPVEQRAQADQQHARFTDKTSDFLTWLNLWRHLREQQRELSGSAFRRMCKREHLNYLRVREWQDFESQLRQVCKELGIQVGKPADEPGRRRHPPGAAGRAALPHRAPRGARPAKDERGPRDYLGARSTRFAIFPGLRRCKAPTRRPDGRRARRDRPPLGAAERRDRPGVGRAARRAPRQAHLLRAALVEEARGRDGLRARHPVRRPAGRRPARPVRPDRPAAEPRAVHPARAGATASGRTGTRVLRENRRLLEEAEELEHRARRRDIVVDEHTLFDFYDARIGPEVVSGAHFDTWWKQERRSAARPARPSTRRCSPTRPPTRCARRTTRRRGRRRG